MIYNSQEVGSGSHYFIGDVIFTGETNFGNATNVFDNITVTNILNKTASGVKIWSNLNITGNLDLGGNNISNVDWITALNGNFTNIIGTKVDITGTNQTAGADALDVLTVTGGAGGDIGYGDGGTGSGININSGVGGLGRYGVGGTGGGINMTTGQGGGGEHDDNADGGAFTITTGAGGAVGSGAAGTGLGGDISLITGDGNAVGTGSFGGSIYLTTGAGERVANPKFGNIIMVKDGGKVLVGMETSISTNVSVMEITGNVTIIDGSLWTETPKDKEYNYAEDKLIDSLPSPETILDGTGRIDYNTMFEKEWREVVEYPFEKEQCDVIPSKDGGGFNCYDVTDFDKLVFKNQTDMLQMIYYNRIMISELKAENELMKASLCKLGEIEWC